MKVLFNGQIQDDVLEVSVFDRALQFGDGIFETIIVRNGEVQFLDDHLQRLKSGASFFNLITDEFNSDIVRSNILKLMDINGFQSEVRIKLLVWRKGHGKGGYSTNITDINWLMTASTLQGVPKIKERTSFSEQVKIEPSSYSQFKTMNALPFIIASLERERRNLDELILLNSNGNIVECTHSNIFWLKEKTYFTPTLDSGCVDGVMRKNLIRVLKQRGDVVKEVLADQQELLAAEKVFSTNVNGISYLKTIDTAQFAVESDFSNI